MFKKLGRWISKVWKKVNWGKVWQKVKKVILRKEVIENTIWYVWSKNRKRYESDPNIIMKLPVGAVLTVFGKNWATQKYSSEKLKFLKSRVREDISNHHLDLVRDEDLRTEKMPTHTAIYRGSDGKRTHLVCEADVFFTFNPIEKYKGKRVVAHWFKHMTVEESEELKSRMHAVVKARLRYDFGGYSGFLTRMVEKMGLYVPTALKENPQYLFCSEGVQTIYQGDPNIKEGFMKDWGLVVNKKPNQVSFEVDASLVTPADIFFYMEWVHAIVPEFVERLDLFSLIADEDRKIRSGEKGNE